MTIRPRAALRAIFFDAGNTLVRVNYAAIADELGRLGHRVTAVAVQDAEWRARVRLDRDLFAGAGTSTESGRAQHAFLRFLLGELGLHDEATLAALADWRRRYRVPIGIFDVPDPDGEAALRLVRAAGLRAAVISNSNGTVRDLLASLRLAPYLDFVIDSGEVGVEKPDPAIFRLALERARVEPSEALYIGDLYSVDVEGARGAGLDAVLIDPGGYWGSRPGLRARGPLEAVRLALAERTIVPADPLTPEARRAESD
jgi:putative hydrolase of the HAD superfamily